jgi:TP901 family phage tail tape measure protein
VQEAQGKSGFLATVKEHESSLDKVGSAMLKIGAVGAVGLGLSAKAAIDWDSAWAGVTKTVSGTPKQLALVESGLRGLARTMPETATQIAAVAENAGQLGIATPDILTFTKTMVQLGDTTNLTSEEAATSFGQLLNIMGDAPKTVGALGDVLVKLGNNGASTEKNILDLGTRLAGAGKQIGLSTPQVLAFGSAISSTGIEAEAGGTAMTQNFFAIDKAVRKGGASLDLYAKTAGMSSDQFRKAWGDDPASATSAFVEGLGRVQASGGSVRGVLDELGIKGSRQADVYARLAGATKAAGAQADLLAILAEGRR